MTEEKESQKTKTPMGQSDLEQCVIKLADLIKRIRAREHETNQKAMSGTLINKDYLRGKSDAYDWCAEELTELALAL